MNLILNSDEELKAVILDSELSELLTEAQRLVFDDINFCDLHFPTQSTRSKLWTARRSSAQHA
jgi:hypothetical protein